jgi:hypothetical protein
MDNLTSWHVMSTPRSTGGPGNVLFMIGVSTKKQSDSIATCKVNGKQLHIRVYELDKNYTLDSKLPRGKTIRELLKGLDDKDED